MCWDIDEKDGVPPASILAPLSVFSLLSSAAVDPDLLRVKKSEP